jgi:hypothetical protein
MTALYFFNLAWILDMAVSYLLDNQAIPQVETRSLQDSHFHHSLLETVIIGLNNLQVTHIDEAAEDWHHLRK